MGNSTQRVCAVSLFVLLVLCSLGYGWTTPVPVSEINTQYIDKTPFISYDALTIYFTRMDTSEFYYSRLYQASRTSVNAPFSTPTEISSLNYSYGHVFTPWVSADNLGMYYARTEPGSMWRLKYTERASINDPWAAGSNILELNTLGHVNQPTLLQNELAIIFSCTDAVGGNGAIDLFMATRPDKDSQFGNIRNLSEINTQYNDHDSCLSADGLTIYFTSDRNNGSDYQLFKASRNSLSEAFSNVEHLSFFDSPGYDIRQPSLSGDGRELYFSKESPTGMADIYVSYVPEPTTVLFLSIGIFALRKRA